jgi:glucose-1-phosphate cytidylyltransferase
MQAVIFAGGLGTRISEETENRPKPMIEIGGMPILWHIMKIYSSYGINEFIVCCGYKGYVIKEFFFNYFMHMSDLTIDISNNKVEILDKKSEPWRVTLVDTGEHTMTGGRLKRIKKYIHGDFCLTYGDGVANIDIRKLIDMHQASNRLATLTAVHPPGRFGALKIDSKTNLVSSFEEKPLGDGGLINGGFFVLHPKVIDFIKDDLTIWEREPLQDICALNELGAYRHEDFWHPMDTLRDKRYLEEIWASGQAPWKIW